MAILTRLKLKQIKATDTGSIDDNNGNKWLSAVIQNSAVNYLGLANAAIGESPAIQAAGSDTNVNLSLYHKGNAAIVVKDSEASVAGKIKVATSSNNGVTLSVDSAVSSSYNVTFPSAAASGDAFMKINSSGNVTFSTASASSFTVSDDITNSTINSGDTIRFRGTANEVDVVVASSGDVTYGLPSAVTLGTSLQAPTLKSNTIANTNGTSVLTFSGISATFAQNLTVTGDLTVSGSSTVIDTTHLRVEDATVIIAKDASNGTAANGAGIFVGGTSNDGSNAVSYLKWNKDNGGVWTASNSVDVAGTGDAYAIGGTPMLDQNGAYFTSTGVGPGIKITGTGNLGRPALDITTTFKAWSDGADDNRGGTNVRAFTLANAPTRGFNQVYMNGILQKGTDDGNSNAYSDLSAGSYDYVLNAANGKIDFLRTEVESGDNFIFYTIDA
jgi:uncharacterized Zn-binding protein involved in type VI secretion